VFLFLEFGLGGSPNTNDGNASRKLGKALLQFLAVVIAGSAVDFHTDLLDAPFDLGFIALPPIMVVLSLSMEIFWRGQDLPV